MLPFTLALSDVIDEDYSQSIQSISYILTASIRKEEKDCSSKVYHIVIVRATTLALGIRDARTFCPEKIHGKKKAMTQLAHTFRVKSSNQ